MHHPEQFEICQDYVLSVPNYIDVYITTSRLDCADEIRDIISEVESTKIEIIEVDDRGGELASILVGMKNILQKYEYICFVHDRMPFQDTAPRVGEAFRDTMFESMLHSKSYIENIISLMERNKYLGVLVPPIAYSGENSGLFCNSWGTRKNYENTVKLCNLLKLNCKISKEKPPLAIGNAFWCKRDALKKMFEYEWKYEDFPEDLSSDGTVFQAIERCWSYVSQDAGYYTGVAYSNKLASFYISNISNMYRKNFGELKHLRRAKNTTLGSILCALEKRLKSKSERKYLCPRLK